MSTLRKRRSTKTPNDEIEMHEITPLLREGTTREENIMHNAELNTILSANGLTYFREKPKQIIISGVSGVGNNDTVSHLVSDFERGLYNKSGSIVRFFKPYHATVGEIKTQVMNNLNRYFKDIFHFEKFGDKNTYSFAMTTINSAEPIPFSDLSYQLVKKGHGIVHPEIERTLHITLTTHGKFDNTHYFDIIEEDFTQLGPEHFFAFISGFNVPE